jgi:hypothetical protein
VDRPKRQEGPGNQSDKAFRLCGSLLIPSAQAPLMSWLPISKYLRISFDDDVQAADLIQEYEARIAALERPVGKQALELEFLKGL